MERNGQHTGFNLQYLHQFPSSLLQDILDEHYEQPARFDIDNVNEFRKIYDDSFYMTRVYWGPQTGKKKIPPTKPYVQFLMLYDLLKREAKLLNLHEFEVSVIIYIYISPLQ